MKWLRFFYQHSLIGFLFRRVREKWFPPQPKPPLTQVNHHGVLLQVDCLPKGMQDVLLAGYYECTEMAILPGFITGNDRVLEIGGAIGFIGLYCRKIVGVAEFVSVEPNPKTLSFLNLNYRLNGFTPTVIQAALAKTDGPVQLNVSDFFWSDSLISGVGFRSATETQSITVEGLNFESIVRRSGIQFNALIIDIEGSEQFLPFESIPDFVNKVLIEIHPEFIGIRNAYNCIECLIRLGFNVEGRCENSWILKRN